MILKDIKLKQKIFLEPDHRRIWNCDETAIWLDLVKGTSVEKIGAKSVPILTFGNEKVRISVLLCCNALGEKLPPFIIAKAKEGKQDLNLVNQAKYMEWLEQFDPMDLPMVSEQIVNLYLGNTVTSSEPKKKQKENQSEK